ncbi:polyprenol-phosphate-mannose-dependent alpha-(1-2)-phosphatidylinositol pentamannoside mannosyltransferase [Mycolicibacterium doricum]|uniref:Alpha-(1-2)-phosphatidylinositol mannosyltransferase n=1 Tax=Mycolicibacterium doricum TaxID=126673 RepID=A0A1X1TF93_9MYCO|nr:mannosyltransferase [Mycolicibacterium doricum]MCV7268382.1 mannosyltransferase [Mycolicibacterium doricum]ORV43200.1 alpha-(1-2)-phosphatidylinositol mannosyltransferase [Mycolicibacterium doricum]BBZ08678.1 polyprenol-phosphate-mannose-dependent alpha-(1-2)-phosphatidylinositol pentamannoside mannosyltransferase [Mycolicibacterium doricum]
MCGIYSTVTEVTGIGYRISRVGQISDSTVSTVFTVDAAAATRLPSRLAAAAPVLLVLSIAARLAWTYLVANGANFVDLHVYVGGAGALDEPGTLYGYVYADQTPDFPLPFTYPPFAAVIFYPLHLLPFGLVAFVWQIGTIAALYGVARLSQRLLAGGGDRRTAMLWTAIGIWLEPLRSTFDYGQVNVLLVLAVLAAVHSCRWWWSGLLVGLAAGVKLTPAVSGLYFLGAGRWKAAVFSAVVFAGTVAVSVAVVGQQARYYFTELLGDADRVGPIGTSFNQSWRGGISRIVGHDAGYGPVVVAAIIATALLALLAWRAVGGSTDRLGAVVIVQLFGLLLSPISWTHHWVWVLPLMIWLWHGPLRQRTGARVLRWGWLALTVIGVPWLLSFAQPTIWEIGRPWYLAWAGLVYIVAALVTLAWVAATGRRSRRSPGPSPNPSP